MRTFGKKNIEYFEFQLEGEDEIYKVPLAADMPFTLLHNVRVAAEDGNGFVAQIDMLRVYMGDVVDKLSSGVLTEILNAWSDESTKTGASVGES